MGALRPQSYLRRHALSIGFPAGETPAGNAVAKVAEAANERARQSEAQRAQIDGFLEVVRAA